MAKCAMCGNDIGYFDKKAQIRGGQICRSCVENIGYSLDPAIGGGDIAQLCKLSIEDIRANLERDRSVAPVMERAGFCIGNYAMFDDGNAIAILASVYSYMIHPHNYSVLRYRNIVDCELIENGNLMSSGGVGSAVVGGLLFGATGAIIGSTTRKQTEMCETLMVKVTVTGVNVPALYIQFIDRPVSKSSQFYQDSVRYAQDVMSKLSMIAENNKETRNNERLQEAMARQAGMINSNSQSNALPDPAAEIRKYKTLMDEGIINAEEFEQKKRMLLAM